MHHIRQLITDYSSEHMIAQYKVVSTDGVAQLIFESSMKPKSA